MSQRLLLEGADPEALLQRAQREYGSEVTVVQAERVRTGGVLGFFARETYALTLEVPGEGAAAGASAIDDARMAAEVADAAQMRRELALAPAPVPASHGDEDGADVFGDLLRDAMGGSGRDGDVARGTRAFSRALFPSVDTDGIVAGSGDGVDLPAAAAEAGSRRDTGAVVLHSWGVQREVLSPAPAAPTAATLLRLGVPARALPAESRIEDPVALHDVLSRVDVAATPVPRAEELLVVVGSPAHAMRVASQVAAWTGSAAHEVVLAGACPPVAGHGRRVQTASAAARVRQRARTSGDHPGPIVVALGAAAGDDGAREAARLAGAFGADATWLVVDAGWTEQRRESAVATMRAEGPAVSLAAVGVSDAQAPAALLDASAPIAWLDGVPCSRTVWAAVLEERIGAE